MDSLAEEDFRLLLDALTQCVLLHDAQTKAIVWANRAACVALGFSVEELLPLKAHDMTRDDFKYRREIAVGAMDRSVEHGPQAYEWCYRSRAGVDMLSEAIATYVRLRERPVVMVQFRDISAEEAMRQKLRSYEMRLREYMQDLGEGVAVITPRGKIAYLSESGRRVLGIEPDAQFEDEALDYCTPVDRERLITQLSSATKRRSTPAQRYRIVRRDGVERWLRITCRRVDIDDELNGVLLHFRDISDEVATEEARRNEARMLEYAGRYNAMGEMATAIAHELSQPLAAVRNFVEGAIQRLSPLEATADAIWGLRAADRQAEHAAHIIKSVREFVVKREPVETQADLARRTRGCRVFHPASRARRWRHRDDRTARYATADTLRARADRSGDSQSGLQCSRGIDGRAANRRGRHARHVGARRCRGASCNRQWTRRSRRRFGAPLRRLFFF